MILSPQNNFAEDVLDILKRRKVTFRGAPPECLELFDIGHIKAWFSGDRNGAPWRGAVQTVALNLDTIVQMGNVNKVADLIEEAIDHSCSRYS